MNFVDAAAVAAKSIRVLRDARSSHQMRGSASSDLARVCRECSSAAAVTVAALRRHPWEYPRFVDVLVCASKARPEVGSMVAPLLWSTDPKLALAAAMILTDATESPFPPMVVFECILRVFPAVVRAGRGRTFPDAVDLLARMCAGGPASGELISRLIAAAYRVEGGLAGTMWLGPLAIASDQVGPASLALAELIRGDVPGPRLAATYAATSSYSEAVARALCEAATDPDPCVVAAAVYSLADAGRAWLAGSELVVRAALRHPNERVRKKARASAAALREYRQLSAGTNLGG